MLKGKETMSFFQTGNLKQHFWAQFKVRNLSCLTQALSVQQHTSIHSDRMMLKWWLWSWIKINIGFCHHFLDSDRPDHHNTDHLKDRHMQQVFAGCPMWRPSNMLVYLRDWSTQLHLLPHSDTKCRFNVLSHRSPYTDAGPASLNTYPTTPGAWHGDH